MRQPSSLSPMLKGVRVLVVEDEDLLAFRLESELKALGGDVLHVGTLHDALERFAGFGPDVVLTDLRLPDGNGLELLQKWRHDYPELPVILMTAHGAVDSAVTALRLGAFDYLQKPFAAKELAIVVRRAAEMAALRQKISGMQGRYAGSPEVEIVGMSAATLRLKEQLQRLARSRADTALVLGASGTGKELAARAIHEWGERRGHPFVEINCASIPESLLESELFGYEKGAFTDARERKLGLFEIARGGSVFLDEIGELPLKLQAKLLRVLEYRRFKRLGGTKDIEFTARVIAATNREPLEEIAAKHFRADLYYRLGALPVRLPLLRDRLDDLEALARFFLARLSLELAQPEPVLTEEALALLRTHYWPGNIRELRNVLQRAMVFYEPSMLEARHIELDVVADAAAPAPSADAPPPDRGLVQLPPGGVNLEDVERSLLVQALERARDNQTRAAQLLGISRHTLRYRLEKHGLGHHPH